MKKFLTAFVLALVVFSTVGGTSLAMTSSNDSEEIGTLDLPHTH
ncbi:hypothetical protein ACFPTR_11145 [Aliibacillus thermotolerans]|uniref:Phosphatase n=1 Tax=Aliibacillus thermotolerans TaxID=1834418 RepID=A0ABW0U8Y1_9BACI|nr:hypothetical protein [Aliibacillus thermotolerans]